MTLQTNPQYGLTPEDYLALEDIAEFRSEYHDGEIFARVGATFAHNAIVSNLNGIFHAQLRGRPCQAIGSTQKVWIAETRSFLYPDVSVVCGEPAFHNKAQTALTNPRLVAEVLSDSTEAYDRGRKFTLYEHLGSLADYLLVSQDEPRIEHFIRQEGGDWLRHVVAGLEATLKIASIECRLDLADIYDRISFPPPKLLPPLQERP